jgi:type IV pilus assembly protein PilM
MADRQPGVWGIDLGQCALKALRLEMVDGQITATAFDYVEHPKILSQPDADPDQLTREALEKLLSRNPLRGDLIAIGVPGQSGLARFVKLPPVEEKKIPDIVRFEAKQQIPFPLDEVVWDYQKIGAGAVADGFAMETEIGLFAMKRDTVNRSLQHFTDVNVEVHLIQMTPLALCNFVAYDLLRKGMAAPNGVGSNGAPPAEGEAPAEEEAKEEEEHEADDGQKRCVVALDIGTDNSNLVVTDGEKIIWQRPIPFGGNHFTRALTKDLKLTFAKAEHLKRNATKSPDLKKILAALKPVLNDFVGEIQRSLGYFTNTHRNARIEYMVGLGNAFRLPGLQKFLSEKLQLDVRKLSKLERLTGESVTNAPSFSQNVLSFATAYGLAVQGLQLTRLQTNLLPPEIQFERMIRSKKPWAVGAAAALLIGVFATTGQYALRSHAVNAETVKTAIKQGDEVIKDIQTQKSRVEAKEAEVKKKENDVRNIIYGNDERLDWMLLNRFVNECLPIPGMQVVGKYKAADDPNFILVKGQEDKEYRKFPANSPEVLVLANDKPAAIKSLKAGEEISVIYNDLSPEAQKYWSRAAEESYRKLLERQAAGRTGADKPEDEGVENLISVNVETIQSLFTPDLKGYWEQVLQDKVGNKLHGIRDSDKKNPPSGKGWVVEVRGYTYHTRHFQFLLDTFVHNLATHGLKEGAAAKEPEKAADAKNPAPQTLTPPKTPPAGATDPKKSPPTSPPDPKKAPPTTPPDPKKVPPVPKPPPTAPPGKDSKPPAPPGKKDDGKKDDKGTEEAKEKVIDPKVELEEKWKSVILGNVSHAFMYSYKSGEHIDDPTRFELIGSSVLNTLVTSTGSGPEPTGGAAKQGPGRPGEPNKPAASGSNSWSPLTGTTTTAGNQGAPGDRKPTAPPSGQPPRRPGGKGPSIGGRGPAGAGGGFRPNPTAPPPTDPSMQTGVDAGERPVKKKDLRPTRTEFIMLFIWKEPLPSEDRGKPGK